MILKKRTYRLDKPVNPFIGALLFLISIVLLLITGPLGFVYGIFHSLFTRGIKGVGEYLLKIAISIDQLGNVMMQHLMNILWTNKNGYKFGNRDETISSALGRNKKLGTLTAAGRLIDKILDIIDPNHSLNSIDYYVEPSEDIIDHLAWIHIEDGQILCLKKVNKDFYFIPKGMRIIGDTDAQTLVQSTKKIFNIDIDIPSMEFVGIFEAQAHRKKPGILSRMTCYTAIHKGKLQPDSQIYEVAWLSYADKENLSEVDQLIFDVLHQNGELA
ncbi:NUDIX hydrolase [Zobellia amurskyensis]|uniref:NUDIX hydrolase n=1 Tax=Zobellia amurskyensis TaxID=248905 RepID=A0A7X3D0P3_9FLAO|nr:NUDIX hydrolase [Zobellia amurskyensis]MUH34820.1 NUDIX hydrolase [Zobellia amurskyensis]